MVAKNFVTPQHASIEAKTDDPESFPEATREKYEVGSVVVAVDGVGGVQF